MSSTPACVDCEYAEKSLVPAGKVRCRRYAPRPGDVDQPRWPLVNLEDWCGEFLEKQHFADEPLESFKRGLMG